MMKSRHEEAARSAASCLRHALVHLAGDELEAREIVFDVAPVADRVRLAQEIDEPDVEAAELVEDEAVVVERLGLHDHLELPLR